MREQYKESLITSCLVMIMLAVGLWVVANQRDSLRKENQDLKQQAVEKGFAEWIVKGYNDTEFKWKE